MTDRETILKALQTLLATIPDIKVTRNETRPSELDPAAPFVGLFDGNKREKTDLNGGSYELVHAAEIELVVSNPDVAARDAEFNRLVSEIDRVVREDRSLGAGADYAETEAPFEPEIAELSGLPGVKFATVPVVFWYVTQQSSG